MFYQNKTDLEMNDNEGLNDYLDLNGYPSTAYIRNIGSALFFLFLYVVLWLIYLLARLYKKTRDHKYVSLLGNMLKWKLSIGLLFSQMAPIVTACLINFYDFKGDNSA